MYISSTNILSLTGQDCYSNVIPRHPPFFPDDTAGWGLTMTLIIKEIEIYEKEELKISVLTKINLPFI
jgi:hypothetical protein